MVKISSPILRISFFIQKSRNYFSYDANFPLPPPLSSKKLQKFDKLLIYGYTWRWILFHSATNMKISTKTKILSLSTLLLSLSGLALANGTIRETIIKTDPSNRIQSIEKIIFSTKGISSDSTAIPLSNQQGVIHLEGKFSTTSTENAETNSNSWENALLIWGKDNRIEKTWKDSTIIVGNWNTIEGEKTIILGGKQNRGLWINSTIVWGNNNTANGKLNNIIWGQRTTLYEQKNISLGAINSTVKGSNNIIAGSNINIAKPNVEKTFVWSDNKKRKDELTIYPQTSNTLYIRSASGVMINTDTSRATLTVNQNQMVQIGDEAGNCSPDKIGTLIFRNGCFYACSDGQKWDNLAGTTECSTDTNTIQFPIPQATKELSPWPRP